MENQPFLQEIVRRQRNNLGLTGLIAGSDADLQNVKHQKAGREHKTYTEKEGVGMKYPMSRFFLGTILNPYDHPLY